MAPKPRRQRADRCRAVIIAICIAFTAASLLFRGKAMARPAQPQRGRALQMVATDPVLSGDLLLGCEQVEQACVSPARARQVRHRMLHFSLAVLHSGRTGVNV